MIWSSPCKRAISYGPYVNVGRLIWVCQIFENAQKSRFILSVSAAVFLFLPPSLQEHELHDNWTWGWLSQSPNLQHYLTTRITIIIPTRGIKLPYAAELFVGRLTQLVVRPRYATSSTKILLVLVTAWEQVMPPCLWVFWKKISGWWRRWHLCWWPSRRRGVRGFKLTSGPGPQDRRIGEETAIHGRPASFKTNHCWLICYLGTNGADNP